MDQPGSAVVVVRPGGRGVRQIVAYTDGSVTSSPKGKSSVGGAGFVADLDGDFWYGRAHVPETTINRVEMLGVAMVLLWAREEQIAAHLPLRVVSDSAYVVKGLNEWVGGWKLNGWKTGKGVPVKNVACWEALEKLKLAYPASVILTYKPRRSTTGAVMADDLAGMARNKTPVPTTSGYSAVHMSWPVIEELAPFFAPP